MTRSRLIHDRRRAISTTRWAWNHGVSRDLKSESAVLVVHFVDKQSGNIDCRLRMNDKE